MFAIRSLNTANVKELPPIFFLWPFCLTQRQTWYLEVCLSAVCVVWRRNNNRKYMTRNPTSTSTDRTFRFSWSPESIGKNTQVFIRSNFKSSGKKNSSCTPLPFGNLSLLYPSTPRKFRDPPWGGGVWIFSGTTQYGSLKEHKVCENNHY